MRIAIVRLALMLAITTVCAYVATLPAHNDVTPPTGMAECTAVADHDCYVVSQNGDLFLI